MNPDDQSPTAPAVLPATLGIQLGAILTHRGVQSAIALWILGNGVVLWLAHDALPFDRPAVANLPFVVQVAAPSRRPEGNSGPGPYITSWSLRWYRLFISEGGTQVPTSTSARAIAVMTRC